MASFDAQTMLKEEIWITASRKLREGARCGLGRQ